MCRPERQRRTPACHGERGSSGGRHILLIHFFLKPFIPHTRQFSEFIEQRYRQYHEYYPLALAVGLLLAAAAWLLQATLLRRVPQ